MDKIKEVMGLVDRYAWACRRINSACTAEDQMQAAKEAEVENKAIESKLRELLERERESCARLCEQSDRYRGSYFAAKIRGMGNESQEM